MRAPDWLNLVGWTLFDLALSAALLAVAGFGSLMARGWRWP